VLVLVESTVDQSLRVASILKFYSSNACLEITLSRAMLLSYFTVRSKKNVYGWHKMVYLRESTFYCSNHGIHF